MRSCFARLWFSVAMAWQVVFCRGVLTIHVPPHIQEIEIHHGTDTIYVEPYFLTNSDTPSHLGVAR
ncbi:hypothetical protein LCGC14_3097040 [marine sediment metagenome]|uniref:Uncharacterized protein n=1 Tax=marine sediment metagenome TaxID=412755 RepID=A0A0F8W9B9_9ZZZZ